MKKCKEKEVFDDIRISMQNFLIVIGSFHSAFVEYRKVVERAAK